MAIGTVCTYTWNTTDGHGVREWHVCKLVHAPGDQYHQCDECGLFEYPGQ